MNEQAASTPGVPGHGADRVRIHNVSSVLVLFSLIDIGIGCRVDDQAWRMPGQNVAYGLLILQVAVGAVQRDEFSKGEKGALKFTADLAILAKRTDRILASNSVEQGCGGQADIAHYGLAVDA